MAEEYLFRAVKFIPLASCVKNSSMLSLRFKDFSILLLSLPYVMIRGACVRASARQSMQSTLTGVRFAVLCHSWRAPLVSFRMLDEILCGHQSSPFQLCQTCCRVIKRGLSLILSSIFWELISALIGSTSILCWSMQPFLKVAAGSSE